MMFTWPALDSFLRKNTHNFKLGNFPGSKVCPVQKTKPTKLSGTLIFIFQCIVVFASVVMKQ